MRILVSPRAPATIHGEPRQHVRNDQCREDQRLHRRRLTQCEQRGSRADQHEPIFRQRELTMAPPGEHQALIVVAAVGLPKSFAAQRTPHERDARVDHERSKDRQREPQRPQSVAPSKQAERYGQEAQRNGTGIAHEDAGRWKIEYQEGSGSYGHTQTRECKRSIARQRRSSSIRAKTDHCHASREAIRAIHEIVQVDHPRHCQR